MPGIFSQIFSGGLSQITQQGQQNNTSVSTVANTATGGLTNQIDNATGGLGTQISNTVGANMLPNFLQSLFGGESEWQKRYNSLTTQFSSANDIAIWYLQGIANNAFPFQEYELNQFHEMFGYKAEAQGHGWRNRIRELSWDTMNAINQLIDTKRPDLAFLKISAADMQYAANNTVHTTQPTQQNTQSGNTTNTQYNPTQQNQSDPTSLPPQNGTNNVTNDGKPKEMGFGGIFIAVGLFLAACATFIFGGKKRRY